MNSSMTHKVLAELTDKIPPPEGYGHQVMLGNRSREVLKFHIYYQQGKVVHSVCVNLAPYMVKDADDFDQWMQCAVDQLPETLQVRLGCLE